MPLVSVNPTTGEVLRSFEPHSPAELERILARAHKAAGSWRTEPIRNRAALVGRVGAELRRQREQLARLVTQEMGKPITQARAEIEKCAWACEYYAEHGPRFLQPEVVSTEAHKSYVRFDPLGVVLAIMPWNFPFWQVFRFAAGAVVAGNVIVLKHAANVSLAALAIERLWRAGRAPAGVFQVILAGNERVGELIADPRVAAVTLTGSERAGQAVAAVAGQHIKKCVLELGGSDALIVLADADLERAAQAAAEARTINSGQSCIAAKRIIVERSIYRRFVPLFVRAMTEMKVGDPMDENTRVGPLARADLVETLHRQVEESLRLGAKLECGGKRLEGKGFFYAPTVLTGVRPGMPVFDEETFGPVAAVVVARDAAHAVQLANASRYGLGAAIWTRNRRRGEALAEQIDAGAVHVNDVVHSDPRLPFGGVKASGYGRELGIYGLREFTNIKSVVMR
ncbi:MAG: NAD-dependent succinate-semialdehyde dehydrogenase [Candidatus Binatia bacterium]|nr:NAD-dependent succinate-semialdehyde dehydrogenase [Candidatus Binatia bacterium]